MTKKTVTKKIKMLYEFNEVRIYKEGRNVVFSYVDHSNDEDGNNNSFCEMVKASVFKNAIVELLRKGNYVLSEHLELRFKRHNKQLTILYFVSDYQTVYLLIDDFDFSKLFF